MHLLYFHKAGRGEWQKKRESKANVRSIYFVFVYYDRIRARVCVCVCVCEPAGSLWVCLFGTSVSTGQLASAQCQSLWLDSERGSL